MNNTCAIILAAGDGKRMKSKKPKVLTEVLFKPMISWVKDHCANAGIADICYVLAPQSDDIKALLEENAQIAVQAERRGTGHAVKMAADYLAMRKQKSVLVLYGDAPFVDKHTIAEAYNCHIENKNAVTVVAAELPTPKGYGRIILKDNVFAAIVEERDASEEEKAIRLINSGVYWFECEALLKALDELKPANAQNEYYLTDTIEIIRATGRTAGVYVAPNANSVLGANDRAALAALNEVARTQVLQNLRAQGVDIPFADGVVISPDAAIAPDTQILPGSIIKGRTVIGGGCVIGPATTVVDCQIGENVLIENSVVEHSVIADGCKIGPYAHLRPNTQLGEKVKVGNFVEVKNSQVGSATSFAHLTYIGDSDVGSRVNVGCGVVTANYDGAKKHRTVIGDEAFIGCNTNFIAPVKIGSGAITAAGTTVDKDVPAGALAIGRQIQQNKENWATNKGKYRKK